MTLWGVVLAIMTGKLELWDFKRLAMGLYITTYPSLIDISWVLNLLLTSLTGMKQIFLLLSEHFWRPSLWRIDTHGAWVIPSYHHGRSSLLSVLNRWLLLLLLVLTLLLLLDSVLLAFKSLLFSLISFTFQLLFSLFLSTFLRHLLL